MANRPTAINVRGARTHNLKSVDCDVPHGRLTVVTGPSGAGKSSLAFDTIYAEGQRRFVESLSTYARQFLDQMERPPLDRIDHLPPAVAIEARNSIKNARSTVGTLTETYDALRLLFTYLGEVQCPRGHGPARRFEPAQAAAELASGIVGERFLLVADVVRPKRGATKALAELVRQGFRRRLDVGDALALDSKSTWKKEWSPLPLVLGRFRASGEVESRLVASVEEAYRLGRGRCRAVGESKERFFSAELGCPRCGERFRTPVPPLFSFNSPLGACPTCQGFGRVIGIDRERVVPDPTLALAERPIAPWNTPAYEDLYDELLEACGERGVPTEVPWRDLTDADREWIWNGDGDFVNLSAFFSWLEKRNYKVHVRVLLARYRSYDPCPVCGGRRLRPEALAVQLAGWALPELVALSIEQLDRWLGERQWSEREREVAGHLLDALAQRVRILVRVGLAYLTLDRQARTLSGGETQRIQLAAALGSGLTSTLYVLDEPTVGLHPRDSQKLLELLRDLARQGNTVLVVEHDRTLITGADHLIDLGPGAGEHGGKVVAEGTPEEVLAGDGLTARYLRQHAPTAARDHAARFRREHGRLSRSEELSNLPRLVVKGARAHNLSGFDLGFPFPALVAVTGVSGSGKSSLIESVLYANYQRARGVVDVDPGECDGLEGFARVEDVLLVDQQPLGRSLRSNPVTYIKAYDAIRRLYAETRSARRSGIKARHFSFNVEAGRCPQCKGTGSLEVDMQFMAPVTVVCDACNGKRFKPEVLAIRYEGLSIDQTLELTIEEALERFAGERNLCRKLKALADVGLGYLRLGQPTSTLSGGEAQRIKLASFLQRPPGRSCLFLFDEPTTGLHLSDIDLLYHTLRRLIRRGDGVVVVEHNLDLISHADWIVDLGPGGGRHGGNLLFSGPLESFLEGAEGPTAVELRRHLLWPEEELSESAG